MLVGTGQLVEQRSLTCILVAHECKREFLRLGQRMFLRLAMKPARLSESGMFGDTHGSTRYGIMVVVLSTTGRHNVDFGGIVETKSQFITMYQQLHRITQRSILDQLHLSAGNYSHIKKMLAQRPLAAHCGNYGRVSYR